MFGKKRKNADSLIYADTQSGEVKKKAPAGKRRFLGSVLVLAAAAVLAMVGTTLWLGYQSRQDRYEVAHTLLADRKYTLAMTEFQALGNYRDSQAQADRLAQQQQAYDAAADLVDQQRYSEAIAAFHALGDYADSARQAACGVTYRKALDLINEIDVGKTQLLTAILADQVRLTDENSYPTTLGYEVAAALLESLGDYESAPALMDRCYYSAGLVKLGWEDWEGALACMDRMSPETAAEFYQDYQQRYNEKAEQEGH